MTVWPIENQIVLSPSARIPSNMVISKRGGRYFAGRTLFPEDGEKHARSRNEIVLQALPDSARGAPNLGLKINASFNFWNSAKYRIFTG
jgi:hypothetical protein